MLKVGDKFPSFEAVLDTGEQFKSEQYLNKNIILYFYPKDNTHGCTVEACSFRDNYGKLKENGLELFGISTDSVTSHVNFKKKHDLPFPLISDKDKAIAILFGVKSKIGTAKRVTFWISNGIIKYVWDEVAVKSHPDDILKVVKA